MLISKRRIIHALSYEIILLVIIAVALSFIFHMPLEVTGVLGIAMAVTSVIWNMVTMCILVYTFIFQWCYDMLEAKLGIQPEAQYSN